MPTFQGCTMCEVDEALVFPIAKGETIVKVGPKQTPYPKAAHQIEQCPATGPMRGFQGQAYHCTRAIGHIGAHAIIDQHDNLHAMWGA